MDGLAVGYFGYIGNHWAESEISWCGDGLEILYYLFLSGCGAVWCDVVLYESLAANLKYLVVRVWC